MSNRLKVSKIQAVLTLRQQGWSFCRIARELDLHRETVSKYARHGVVPEEAKPAKVLTGSEDSKPTEVRTGTQPGRSLCEPFRDEICKRLKLGLSAERIFDDLRHEQGFPGGYHSVRRFIRSLTPDELPVRRLESLPGEEAQVDFGSGSPVVTPDGKRRRSHVFRIVLSCSRKGYSEAVDRQTTENFIKCLENAFRHFGGAPRTVVIDNLRAAVSQADWYEPELNPRLRDFAHHYGTVILPTRPYTPRHKGKIESGIKYVKNHALKGKTFTSYQSLNDHLASWESQVADTRIHGTTRQQVRAAFLETERSALLRLPLEPFPFYHEAKRKVHRDGHVEVAKAYYSVPPEYFRRHVWVRWDSRTVRIFNLHLEQLAIHVRHQPGAFSTDPHHLHPYKVHRVERGIDWILQQAALLGKEVDAWCQAVVRTRGIQGTRTLLGVIDLRKRYPLDQINRACGIASSYGAYRLANIRSLLGKQAPIQEQFEFMREHPIIRSMNVYGELVKSAARDRSSTDNPTSPLSGEIP